MVDCRRGVNDQAPRTALAGGHTQAVTGTVRGNRMILLPTVALVPTEPETDTEQPCTHAVYSLVHKADRNLPTPTVEDERRSGAFEGGTRGLFCTTPTSFA